jgi:ABC-type glycerol-3-phosphate transport system permease component
MKSDMKPGRLFLIYGGLFLTFLFLLLPIVWLVFSSFRSNDSIQAGQLWPAPGDFTLANYAEVFHINGLVGFLVNSIVIATATTLLVVFLGSLAAYGLSRFALRGKELFMTAALLPQFFPLRVGPDSVLRADVEPRPCRYPLRANPHPHLHHLAVRLVDADRLFQRHSPGTGPGGLN